MKTNKIFSVLTMDEIVEKLNTIKGGQFSTIKFFSEPKTINKEVIYKVTEMQLQTKIDYTHRADYVEPTFHREEDSEYLIDKAIKHNNNTNKDLFTACPLASAKPKVHYYTENGTEITADVAKAIIKPKAPSKNPLVFMTINCENILSLT